jgi:hypothetical protein
MMKGSQTRDGHGRRRGRGAANASEKACKPLTLNPKLPPLKREARHLL